MLVSVIDDSAALETAAADASYLQPFGGSPQRYRRISILLSVGIHVWLYGGFSAIKYFVHGETWVFGAKPILISLGSMLLFGRIAYRWMMRLDAQYGSGTSWRLDRRIVKLPEFVTKAEKASRQRA